MYLSVGWKPALGRACGIPGPMLHRFIKDGLDLRLTTADKLGAFFGCELTDPAWGIRSQDTACLDSEAS